MSDPVKNAEVEDVLSSIRRLVTEDKRPLQATKPAPRNDRLVLTPALRVEEDVTPSASIVEELDTTGEVLRSILVEEEAEVDEVAAQVEEAFEVKEVSENYEDDPYNFDDEQEKDGDVLDALLLTDPTENGGAAGVEASAEDTTANVDTAANVDTPADIDTPDTKTATLSAKIAALETAIGDISDEWEPDGASQDAYAGSEPEAMIWEDDIEDEPEVAFSHHVEIDEVEEIEEGVKESEIDLNVDAEPVQGETTDDVNGPAAGFPFGTEDQLMDEDTLREMISEIVQSELQGALGERITRNVRRLVRREIHRALTARDLD